MPTGLLSRRDSPQPPSERGKRKAMLGQSPDTWKAAGRGSSSPSQRGCPQGGGVKTPPLRHITKSLIFAAVNKTALDAMSNEQEKRRGYALGVQMFETIRQRGSAYIDKTKYVWQMVSTDAQYFFLSRPRRFGKSLLVDTLRCYFEGRKELFEGLYLYDKEQEWKKYPVIRLNMNSGKYYEKESFHGTVGGMLRRLEEEWHVTPQDEFSYDDRLTELIKAAYEQTGEKVVILIDEYDAPMLDSITNPELQDYLSERVRNLFSPLKAQEPYLRFVFLTGISKFSQLTVFSELNNLQQMTFDPNYEAVCGITEEELLTDWKTDIELLTEKMNKLYSRWGIHYTYDDIVAKLKQMYDGYRFAKSSPDIYNPFSLLKCFNHKDISNYWFDSGTPTFLIRQMQNFRHIKWS